MHYLNIQSTGSILFILTALAAALTIIYFAWNLAKYIFFGADDAERAHAKDQVLNATITIVFIMILWGIGNALYRLWS